MAFQVLEVLIYRKTENSGGISNPTCTCYSKIIFCDLNKVTIKNDCYIWHVGNVVSLSYFSKSVSWSDYIQNSMWPWNASVNFLYSELIRLHTFRTGGGTCRSNKSWAWVLVHLHIVMGLVTQFYFSWLQVKSPTFRKPCKGLAFRNRPFRTKTFTDKMLLFKFLVLYRKDTKNYLQHKH